MNAAESSVREVQAVHHYDITGAVAAAASSIDVEQAVAAATTAPRPAVPSGGGIESAVHLLHPVGAGTQSATTICGQSDDGRVYQVLSLGAQRGPTTDGDGDDVIKTVQLIPVAAAETDVELEVDGTSQIKGEEGIPLALADCPSWATQLRDCERIGDAYRGFVDTETELDQLLTRHKQETASYWGTRQSPPNQRQPSKRLMWKSQYVPYDGIPFVNAGSRAMVMECQYGPRRRANVHKRALGSQHLPAADKASTNACPARIYLKKVVKFPQFKLSLSSDTDKKLVKQEQERTLALLRDTPQPAGVERYYLQLPTEAAHEYHEDQIFADIVPYELSEVMAGGHRGSEVTHRVDPRVAGKIRELVTAGVRSPYLVRKELRVFVERELFEGGRAPQRHNLVFYPTINDIQNHVRNALRAMETSEVVVTSQSALSLSEEGLEEGGAIIVPGQLPSQLSPGLWAEEEEEAPVQRVKSLTVTLTQSPDDANSGTVVISRVTTTLTDGTSQVCDTLTPETARLLSQLSPKIFSTAPSQSEDGVLQRMVTVEIEEAGGSKQGGDVVPEEEEDIHTPTHTRVTGVVANQSELSTDVTEDKLP